MPLYEYKCQSCDQQTEVIQRFSDPPLAVCEECGGELRKLISVPAFQFKGSGWYVTDYARKSQGESGEKSEEKTTSKTEESSSGKDKGSDSSKKDSSSSGKDSPKKSSEGMTKAERTTSNS